MRAWDEFLALLEIELGSETINKWLKPLKVIRYDACNLYLEAKDSFHAMWFEEHIRPKTSAKFVNNNNKKIKIHLSIANKTPTQKVKNTKIKKDPYPAQKLVITFDNQDTFCTLDNFVVTENNLLVSKLFNQLSDELGAFNPIFIYGPSGSGKTHLLMAAAQDLRAKGLRVIYVRAETFTEHVVTAIRLGEMRLFRETYRNTDILIVDDVQIFSKKAATQEEFFHTFNTLHLDGKQIILSANCSPSELQQIEPRLVSRFEWGIALNLSPLTKDCQAKLLEKKAAFLNFPLHQKVIDFLIENFSSGSKSLIRAVEALALRAHLNGQSDKINTTGVTVAMAKQLLNDLIIEEQKQVLTPGKAIQYVAEVFGMKIDDILGKAQTRDCVLPRQLAMYICRQKLKLPFIKIGEVFSKDHSTVMSSVKLIQASLDSNDKEILNYYHSIQKKIENSLT